MKIYNIDKFLLKKFINIKKYKIIFLFIIRMEEIIFLKNKMKLNS